MILLKRKIRYKYKEQTVEKEMFYIPVRYITTIAIAIFEILLIAGIVVSLCYSSPYFYFLALLTQLACILRIVASDDNPEYKIPWLMFVLIVPVVGFMLYFMLYSRTLRRRYRNRLKKINEDAYHKEDSALLSEIRNSSPLAATHAKMLCTIADTHIFTNTSQTFLPLGEEMQKKLLEDLENAESFIYMEYYIIEEGKFWDSVLEILKRKAAEGLDVRLIYDDIGCMTTIAEQYFMYLRSFGIKATVFSMLRSGALNEFNNRSHRKITVIDGKIGYTGGINLADEYININSKVGHFKDTAIRLEGEAVYELTRLFLVDYGINVIKIPENPKNLFPKNDITETGYLIPFGDGPKPVYMHNVSKTVILNMINSAVRYVYMETPYLVLDNEVCSAMENAALRGVDVKIILPKISDSKIIGVIGRSYYMRLISAGVNIYEYTPGFIHSKCYISDDEFALIGTMNLDYRSLVHNFENGVWMYKCRCISDMRSDFESVLAVSEMQTAEMHKAGLAKRFLRALIRIFAPML